MQRITKRNEQGGIEIDGITLALNRLAEYEDTGLEPSEIHNMIDTTDAEGYRRGYMEACQDLSNKKDKPEDEPHEIKAYGLDEPDPNMEADNGR